jgi:hypothetical protein
VAQTVHFAASLALEWWCATTATAETNVSSRHRNAIRFENDRITIAARTSLKIYTENRNERNPRIAGSQVLAPTMVLGQW